MGEQVKRSGPEPLKLGTQLVGQRRPRADEILPPAGQRPQRLGLIAIGLEHPEAVIVGARQLAEHERVKPIGLPARDPKSIASRRDLVGMQGQDPQPRVQQPLHQQPVRPLDRDQLDLQAHQRPAQRPQPLLVVHKRGRQQLLARRISHEHVVLLRRPIHTGITSHLYLHLSVRTTRQCPDQEVPLRMLIDRPSTGATSCCRFAAPHLRREGLVCFRPSHGQAVLALSRRRSRQLPG